VLFRSAGHERLGCQSCHSAWTPYCPSCHTRYDASGTQWDFGTGREETGRWIESHEGVGISATPQLGAWRDDSTLGPVVPGMNATIDAREIGGSLLEFHRVASFDPHTTGRDARSCASCHGTDAAATSRTSPAHD
jgi:hypothetical protein